LNDEIKQTVKYNEQLMKKINGYEETSDLVEIRNRVYFHREIGATPTGEEFRVPCLDLRTSRCNQNIIMEILNDMELDERLFGIFKPHTNSDDDKEKENGIMKMFAKKQHQFISNHHRTTITGLPKDIMYSKMIEFNGISPLSALLGKTTAIGENSLFTDIAFVNIKNGTWNITTTKQNKEEGIETIKQVVNKINSSGDYSAYKMESNNDPSVTFVSAKTKASSSLSERANRLLEFTEFSDPEFSNKTDDEYMSAVYKASTTGRSRSREVITQLHEFDTSEFPSLYTPGQIHMDTAGENKRTSESITSEDTGTTRNTKKSATQTSPEKIKWLKQSGVAWEKKPAIMIQKQVQEDIDACDLSQQNSVGSNSKTDTLASLTSELSCISSTMTAIMQQLVVMNGEKAALETKVMGLQMALDKVVQESLEREKEAEKKSSKIEDLFERTMLMIQAQNQQQSEIITSPPGPKYNNDMDEDENVDNNKKTVAIPFRARGKLSRTKVKTSSKHRSSRYGGNRIIFPNPRLTTLNEEDDDDDQSDDGSVGPESTQKTQAAEAKSDYTWGDESDEDNAPTDTLDTTYQEGNDSTHPGDQMDRAGKRG
jgi:hypothetical protein